jgi:hypothetical protein
VIDAGEHSDERTVARFELSARVHVRRRAAHFRDPGERHTFGVQHAGALHEWTVHRLATDGTTA